ncbi:oligosaccharide flippase family protein [Actinacidiphila oryziradicis]|uniref:oligosaccharide flippase family protein n=1 Tax=Actinacidiphila oryziradicis TaxID=2571141 RepID=UPI00145CD7F1|nr:oligosaccharide flippase family protein [Actinacidiphila oryziradicis]
MADRDRAQPHAARSVIASLGWNYVGATVAVPLQLAYTAYTGRTVALSSFGSYAIALTMVQLVGFFANAGLSAHLLRAERLTLQTVRAARHLSVVSGVIGFALIETVAPICGALWRMPELIPFMRLLGYQFLFQPVVTVTIAVLRRAGRARAAVTAEVAGQSTGFAVSVLLLACGWNPLGLAAAQPASAVASLTVATLWLHRCALSSGPPVGARDLLAPSGFLAGYSLVQFVTNSVPMWVAGRLFGPGTTGSYSRAALLTGLPLTFLAQGLVWAATPALAERQGLGIPLGRSVEHTLCMASATAFIGFGAMAGFGPAALSLLLGPGWGAAAALVPMLALGAAMALLCSFGGSIDQVRGAPRALIGTQLAVMTATAAGVVAAAALHSIVVLAGAAAAGQAVGHLSQLMRWHRSGLLRVGVALRMHLIHAAVGAALGGTAALGADGRSRTAAVMCSLAAMLPVVVGCALLRRRLPLYAAAVAVGLNR